MHQDLIKLAAASLVSVASANNAAASGEPPAKENRIGISAAFDSGCRILSGQCDGNRQSVAIRFGNPAERREWVVSAGEFSEATKGGFDRSFAVTHRGDKLGALDFWLHGGLGVRGKTLALDKAFPLGEHGVLQLGGYIGRITGRAEAEVGAAVSVVRPALRYEVSRGQAVEQESNFGGLRQAAGFYLPLFSKNTAITAQQQLDIGMDKGRASLGIGLAYFANPEDRAAMRPDSGGTQIQTAKGAVVSLQLCASELLYDKMGQKLDARYDGLASRINGYTAQTERYGQHIAPVSGASIAQLMGYATLPRRDQAVSLSVAVPLGKGAHIAATVRRSPLQTSTSAMLSYNF